LGNDLAPYLEQEGFSGATEDANEVVLSGLDCLLRQVAVVVIRWNKLEGRVCFTKSCAVGGREFVVEHLVLCNDVLIFFADMRLAMGKYHFSLGPVFHWFDP